MPIVIDPVQKEESEMSKLASHANLGIDWVKRQPDHSKTILAIGAVALFILFILNFKVIFWSGVFIFILYLIGVKTLRKKEPPKPLGQPGWN